MKRYLSYALLFFSFTALPLSAAELVTIKNVVLADADLNDGDSFRVRTSNSEFNIRLYYVDCPETTYGSKTDLERIRQQQRYFGLKTPKAVVRFGQQATSYVKQILSAPFTVHTARAWAPGRSSGGRYYAFVETNNGHDLGHLLVEQGLARVHGKTRPAPDGTPSQTVLAELRDLHTAALLKQTGIWKETDPELLPVMREAQRKKDEELTLLKNNIEGPKKEGNNSINLNSASKRELRSIPGVGPVTAAKIIAGRPYYAVEDLLNIPGIGAEKLATISRYVSVRSNSKVP